MAAENKSIPSLYALKTLAAFFVVVIHFPMLGKQQLEPLVRTAVPLFYIITGFFLYKGTQEKEVCTAKHWVKKVIVCSILLNVCYAIWNYVVHDAILTPQMLIKAALSGNGISVPLWYLTALWQALLVFILLRKRAYGLMNWSIALCLLNPLLGRYCFLFMENGEQLYTSIRTNALTVALPYLCIGYASGKYQLCSKWGKIQYPIILGVAMYAEYYTLQCCGVNNHVSYLFTTAAFSWAFFLWVQQYKGSLPYGAVEIGKQHSANIYYWHSAVGAVIIMLLPGSAWKKMVAAPIVFLLSLLLSMLLLFGKEVVRKKLMHRN